MRDFSNTPGNTGSATVDSPDKKLPQTFRGLFIYWLFRYSEFVLFPFARIGFVHFSIEKKECLVVVQSHTLKHTAMKALLVRSPLGD